MSTLEQLRLDMKRKHSETQSWQKVGNEYGINKALARLIANGYQPGKKVRLMLGLPKEVSVIVIFGEVPPGAMTMSALFCECGQAFIPNHPRRKKCFVCSPYKKRLRKKC